LLLSLLQVNLYLAQELLLSSPLLLLTLQEDLLLQVLLGCKLLALSDCNQLALPPCQHLRVNLSIWDGPSWGSIWAVDWPRPSCWTLCCPCWGSHCCWPSTEWACCWCWHIALLCWGWWHIYPERTLQVEHSTWDRHPVGDLAHSSSGTKC
jgi:hypothetical protein